MWPAITYETCAWHRDPDELAFVSKTQRRRILSTYEAAVPAAISEVPVELSAGTMSRLVDIQILIARFDEVQAWRGFDLPVLLLRSESSSSSQIERLTSSVRNVALAELTEKAPSNARLIAGNVAAMRAALTQEGPITVDSICGVHDVLMKGTGEAMGLRNEQVWIGGTAYSPHGAAFVPPRASRVRECLDDLVLFARRDGIPSVAKAAILHAQFETIHPFTDGNGRTGRTLMHRMLALDGALQHATLPVSAGLLHDVDRYMSALDAYHEGEIEAIVECVVDALRLAVLLGMHIAADVEEVLEGWRSANTDRIGSASHRLPALLVEQPVVNTGYVAERLGISDRAARTLVDVACERGILTKMGNARRGDFYQASELLAILEEASSVQGIRRIASR